MTFKEALRPTLGKIIATIILVMAWFYFSYNAFLPSWLSWLWIVIFIIFGPPMMLGISGQGSADSSLFIVHLVAILWSYFLVCLIFHTLNVIRGKNE